MGGIGYVCIGEVLCVQVVGIVVVVGCVVVVGVVVGYGQVEVYVQVYVFMYDVGFVQELQWGVDLDVCFFYVGFGGQVGQSLEGCDEFGVVVWVVGVVYGVDVVEDVVGVQYFGLVQGDGQYDGVVGWYVGDGDVFVVCFGYVDVVGQC